MRVMPVRKVDPAVLRDQIELLGWTQRECAEHWECNRTSIERMCKRHQLKTQRTGPRSGPGHPDWKGGRVLVGDYWYLWAPDHPNCTARGYVAEHRLVMSLLLGRPLTRKEVVHHRDSDTWNNQPDNLQLFASNAEHLKHELTGRVPNWTPEGYARIGRYQRQKPNLRLLEGDVPARTQSSGHSQN